LLNGIQIQIDGRTLIEYDLTKVASIEGTTLGLNLPGKIAPVASGEVIELGFVAYNPLELYGGSPQDTIDGWAWLEANGVMMTQTAYALVSIDVLRAYVGPEGSPRLLPTIPMLVSLGRLAYYAKQAQKLEEDRNCPATLAIVRRKLNPCATAYMTCIEGKDREIPLPVRLENVSQAVNSVTSEFSLALRTNNLYPVEINEKRAGPDFYIKGKLIHNVEVATRSSRLNMEAYETWEKISNEDPKAGFIPFDPIGLVSGCVMEVANRLEHELSQGELVIFDMSNTLEGYTMLAAKALSKEANVLDLGTELKKALAELEEGRKAIVFTAEANGAFAAGFVPVESAKGWLDFVQGTSLPKLRRQNPYLFQKMFNTALGVLNNQADQPKEQDNSPS